MAKGRFTAKRIWQRLYRIGIVFAITVLLAFVSLFGLAFVLAKGPAESISDRMCATFAEHRFPLAGVFFSSEELAGADFYLPPEVADCDINTERGEFVNGGVNSSSSGEYWDSFEILKIDPDSLLLAKNAKGSSSAALSLGLSEDIDAVLIGDYLTYRGEDGDVYCFCAMDADGVLHIGAMSAYDAANSGYVWGISADRVLVSDGAPLVDLGGGYADRGAIGQTADGEIIIIYADGKGIYPRGITYDELAAKMYSLGAVNAAALKADGATYIGGELVSSERNNAAYSLIVMGGGQQ